MSESLLKVVRVYVVFGVDKAAQVSYEGQYGTYARRAANAKTYHYLALEEFGLKKGDVAVVKAPSHGLTCVTVTEDPEEWTRDIGGYKWIVDKVDTARLEDVMDRLRRREELHKTLTKMAREARERMDFEQLLGHDPVALELIKELRELT